MNSFQEYYDAYNNNSYVRQLNPDPETVKYYPNKTSRSVKSGHYVLSESTPIPDPVMIQYSESLARQLKIPRNIMESDQMLKYLSGHKMTTQWVTPYGLSIYGQKMISNCPYKNNTGYGDGRLHSIGEFLIDGKRWEFQLKGSGMTPFSRGGDGRAVLRSSIREFLASEAMYHLNVPTTRSLSLIVSTSEKVSRPWYKLNDTSNNTLNDTTKSKCSVKGNQCGHNHDDIMELSPATITCRVSESFIRVGHFELFGIRAIESINNYKLLNSDIKLQELELLFDHMLSREYPHLSELSIDDAVISVCEEFAVKISTMVAHWMRCGYVQSNFNSDNCLVSGKTMDYGPFGFMEKYDPNKNFWTGGGAHFSFMNQMNAAKMNYIAFVESLKPLLTHNHQKLINCINEFDPLSQKILNQMWAKKLGLVSLNWKNTGNKFSVEPFFNKLLNLMKISDFDYTIFWRQLSECPLLNDNKMNDNKMNDNKKIYELMSKAFYGHKISDDWKKILDEYLILLTEEQQISHMSASTISKNMKLESPKYVPREWMLVKAYTDAQNNSYESFHKLYELFKKPYDEHLDMEDTYYVLTPLDMVKDKPGFSHMSCSS